MGDFGGQMSDYGSVVILVDDILVNIARMVIKLYPIQSLERDFSIGHNFIAIRAILTELRAIESKTMILENHKTLLFRRFIYQGSCRLNCF